LVRHFKAWYIIFTNIIILHMFWTFVNIIIFFSAIENGMIKSIFVIYYFTALIRKNGCQNSPIHLRNLSVFTPSVKICEYWFRWFKSGDFVLKDEERSGQPKEKFEDAELQVLLDENSSLNAWRISWSINVDKSM